MALLLGFTVSEAAWWFEDSRIAAMLTFMIVAVLSVRAILYWVFESVGSPTGFVLSKSVLAAIGLSPIAVFFLPVVCYIVDSIIALTRSRILSLSR